MKKICCLILIVLIILFSTSCKRQTDEPYISNSDDNVKYERANTDGINGVYIITDKGPVAIAYTNNGKLNLSGDVYYYNIKNILANEESVKQKTITLFDENGFNKGSLSYGDFEKTKQPAYKMLALTGNWRLCPDIRHIEYKEKQTLPQEYSSFISKNLKDKTNETVRITDVWETDLDCDGSNEAVIKAHSDKYTLVALMSATMGNVVIYSDFENKSDAFPFFADLDGNGKPSLVLLTGSNLKSVNVYRECTAELQYCVYLPIV